MSYLRMLLVPFLYLQYTEQALAFATEVNVTQNTRIDGCAVCGEYKCPEIPERCLLGTMSDVCGCCPEGVCAKLSGEACWNSSISQLPFERRNEGLCAKNYLCQLRLDLQPEDVPEAICVCIEQSPACGSNNETYDTPCALHEEARRSRNQNLKLDHLGPCPSRPWIESSSKNISGIFGTRIVLSCEAEGFPVPDIFWEFHSVDNLKVLKLPNEDHDGVVRTKDGPEPMMRTSWMQLPRLEKDHAGTYHCIASNSVGEASSTSFLSIS
ncbi:insulin-like growth factor-binding protein-related protein 1 [Belonocnema kinseyi]|uniref:insulin-like growth factor-binding protein-related protein 1 n=1 Tax=Belonocnema kinseyi TaxID=2817044 RepID=UPI00143D7380|nr:insulin-like growth factor-binding protein-related protein 1 [Belonocnema kinseyi]